jgi:thymidine kinase
MFIEPQIKAEKKGWIEVICGSMFSGKTEELIRRLNRANYANRKVEIFKPLIDNRYDDEMVVSHDKKTIRSTPVSHSENILLLASEVEVVGIDEAQFFDEGLPLVCNTLANKGVRVIIAGLDMDYLGKPFGIMPHLMAIADFVTKVHAICMKCGNPSLFSHRMVENSDRIMLGEKEYYEPLCRACFNQSQQEFI